MTDGQNEAHPRRRERRRRRSKRLEIDTTIPSPCISVCQLDKVTNCCIGCFRSIDEIREWPIMSAEEKQASLARIAERKFEARPGLSGRKNSQCD